MRTNRENEIRLNDTWKGVPEQHLKAWYQIFQSSREILKLSAKCPMCGNTSLYRWFLLSDVETRRGGGWEWCRTCKRFEHYSAKVPQWWECDLAVNTHELTPYPDVIERAIIEREQTKQL